MRLTILMMAVLLLNCKMLQPKQELDDVEQFAAAVITKVEALYSTESDDGFLKIKEPKEGTEKQSPAKEYVKYSVERQFSGRLVTVEVSELMVGTRTYYRMTVRTKTIEGSQRSIETVELRQRDIKPLLRKLVVAMKKVL